MTVNLNRGLVIALRHAQTLSVSGQAGVSFSGSLITFLGIGAFWGNESQRARQDRSDMAVGTPVVVDCDRLDRRNSLGCLVDNAWHERI